jgi:hypothetical protein
VWATAARGRTMTATSTTRATPSARTRGRRAARTGSALADYLSVPEPRAARSRGRKCYCNRANHVRLLTILGGINAARSGVCQDTWEARLAG